jgi:hypothetical protein
MPTRSIDQSQDTAVLISSFLKHGQQRDVAGLDVEVLRTAILLQSSELIAGLVIAALERTFKHATADDRNKIAKVVDRLVSAEGRSGPPYCIGNAAGGSGR